MMGSEGLPGRSERHTQWDASLRLVRRVLPISTTDFAEALLNSSEAFEHYDRWTRSCTLDVLRGGVPADEARLTSLDASDYPLAPLLISLDKQKWTGLPLLKALLLVAAALDNPEKKLLMTVADGARLSQEPRWAQVRLGPLEGQPNLRQVLEHCRAHAVAEAGRTKEHKSAQLNWLKSLGRLCEYLAHQRLSSPSKATPPVRIEIPPPSLSAAEEDELQYEWPEFWGDEGDEAAVGESVDPEQSRAVEQVEELPRARAPEAQEKTPKAPARQLDAPVTPESGEGRRARTGFQSALSNQFLPRVNHEMTPEGRAALVHSLKSGLQSGDQSVRDVVGILAIAHVTGCLVEQVVVLPLEPGEGCYLDVGSSSLMRAAPAPAGAWKPEPGQLPLMRPKASHVRLELPDEIRQWLSHRVEPSGTLGEALKLSKLQAVARTRDWLTVTRNATVGDQTLGRVERWLANALYQSSHDHVVPWLLCGINDSQACPAGYYRSYRTSDLSRAHRHVLTMAGWSMSNALAMMETRAYVGSNLDPEVSVVQALWASTTAHFERIVHDESNPLHVRHNARETYEVLSLVFQTLHRAVSDPLESLEFIDLEAGRLLIVDKQQGEARAHRIVPLGALALSQCKDHVEHVRRLIGVILPSNPSTAGRLAAMLDRPSSRAAPFRFFLNERLDIVRIIPGEFEKALAGVWTLPINLARHFGCTWLLERGVEDAVLCSLLGHHDLGTQNLSLFSPLQFDGLYGQLLGKLDELASEMGLRSIPTFLLEAEVGASIACCEKPAQPMKFGHELRAEKRQSAYVKLREEMSTWIAEQLGDRPQKDLTQDDVDAVFNRVREASPNRRNYWASQRLEAMREAVLNIVRSNEELKVELPDIALTIKDVSHICPQDGIMAVKWLRLLRSALNDHWDQQYAIWKVSRGLVHSPEAKAVILSLVVESLVVDPEVWQAWDERNRQFRVVLTEASQPWILSEIPGNNVRLYPVRPDLAALVHRLPADAVKVCKLDDVAQFAADLVGIFDPGVKCDTFARLLALVRGGVSLDAPGLVIGYADGSHAAVSVQRMCLERTDVIRGRPSRKSVADWMERRKRAKGVSTDGEVSGDGGVDDAPSIQEHGTLKTVADFRRKMSGGLRQLVRRKPKRTTQKSVQEPVEPIEVGETQSVAATADKLPDAETQESSKPNPEKAGLLKRFIAFIEENERDFLNSPELPRICALVGRWIYALAVNGMSPREPYAPKTLLNYWYSWGLRMIEEFGSIDPIGMTTAELEEIYLQIVEDASVSSRNHLYGPMRSLHRYMVVNQGASEINWEEIRRATGQGLTHVDANIIYLDEYLRAIDLLLKDPHASEKVRHMQAAAAVLQYRCGLRISECLGLRAGDVFKDAATCLWNVAVQRNVYRRLKNKNSRRNVVVLEELEPTEVKALEGWIKGVQQFSSAATSPLFSKGEEASNESQERYPSRLIALRIGQSLRLATGDPSIRVHHCRHTFATRIVLKAMGLPFERLWRTDETNQSKHISGGLCSMLTTRDQPTRRVIWAVATMLGHASPITTFSTYFHGGHLLLEKWCQSHWWKTNVSDDLPERAAFARGVSRRTMQRQLQRGRADVAGGDGSVHVEEAARQSGESDSTASTAVSEDIPVEHDVNVTTMGGVAISGSKKIFHSEKTSDSISGSTSTLLPSVALIMESSPSFSVVGELVDQGDIPIHESSSPRPERSTRLRQYFLRTGIEKIVSRPLVEEGSVLPPISHVNNRSMLVVADRIVGHAARFGRIDGLADDLYASEVWAQAVVDELEQFLRSRDQTESDDSGGFGVAGLASFSIHEMRQVTDALRTLQKLSALELTEIASIIERCLVVEQAMLVVESASDMKALVGLLLKLVSKPSCIEVLRPAVLAKRDGRDDHRSEAELGLEKPRLKYSAAVAFRGDQEMLQVAADHQLVVALHGKVPGARFGSHSAQRASARFGIRVTRNSTAEVRSAKVLTRILTSAAVAMRAHKALGADAGPNLDSTPSP